MAEEHELTPEEKLLEVIQKGESTPSESHLASGDVTLGDDSDGQVVSRDPQKAGPISFRSMNQILVLIAVALLALSGYEVYLNLPQPDQKFAPTEIDLHAGGTLVMASLSDTLDMFAQRRITGKVPKPVPVGGITVNPEDIAGWRAHIRDYYKFMGTSVVQRKMSTGDMGDVHEAIVMDTKVKKMHFLTVGQTIVVSKIDVLVETIDEDKVVFVSGQESLTVTGSGAE